MEQSHISEKNMTRLKVLEASANPRIAELASIVLEVARIKPFRKRRLKILAEERRDSLEKLEKTGLIYAHDECYGINFEPP
jgi:hypothetical protein